MISMVYTMHENVPSLLPQKPQFNTVAQTILEQLRLWGVERIYGVVGDAVFGLMDAIANQEEISFIAVKHESVAAMMASAEAKITGRLGVCIAQMGPGLANLINGLGDAFMDKAPVLAITGQAPLNKIGTFYKQYINQQELAHAISLYSQLVVHPDAVVDSLKQAMYTSVLHRTVSHLSIPADVFTMTTAAMPYEQPELSIPVSDSKVLHQVMHLLHSAKQPMILVGSQARSARESIQTLAEKWGSGILVAGRVCPCFSTCCSNRQTSGRPQHIRSGGYRVRRRYREHDSAIDRGIEKSRAQPSLGRSDSAMQTGMVGTKRHREESNCISASPLKHHKNNRT
ncbi:thiamine pyrophosphate-binding protein [Paenibacillus alginolyticus]|uniref:Thiamine pyrophosphate-binding protein n=1 Tax=Paenibacillus alginolyticus TaxID=59839 RepID=A0ABT4GEX8_9BACL|nr:thiamine pyrophosphate-binding protein [Paenibacillus alginolyticus]MCY9664182.1 thiamine pyrophosphate-binding protein [Paenibacillus alginolyticus]MCY9694739.1 thiamine pyrophosphate-binding protein [Paenibacillus alginolyticus]MEC0147090.1 thiamine pyrophosphate-binding protein [Paenibacillus alginolyticus]